MNTLTPTPRSPRRASERGFTLIEVLVALLILAVGLLGLAALQTQGVRFNHDAQVRTQATTLATDLLEQMRIERQRLQVMEDAGTPDMFPERLDQFITANFPARPWTQIACDPLATDVDSQMVCWLWRVESQLPLGSAAVAQQVADLNAMDITLRWLDREPRDFDGVTRLPLTEAECEARVMREWTAPNCMVIQTWTVRP